MLLTSLNGISCVDPRTAGSNASITSRRLSAAPVVSLIIVVLPQSIRPCYPPSLRGSVLCVVDPRLTIGFPASMAKPLIPEYCFHPTGSSLASLASAHPAHPRLLGGLKDGDLVLL